MGIGYWVLAVGCWLFGTTSPRFDPTGLPTGFAATKPRWRIRQPNDGQIPRRLIHDPKPADVTAKLLAASLALDASLTPSTQSDPDRWCWPHSQAMNGREIDIFAKRVRHYMDKGLSQTQAEALAEQLLKRDRQPSGWNSKAVSPPMAC